VLPALSSSCSYGDCSGNAEPLTKNFGLEWIEVELSNSIYVSSVELFETLTPGMVTRIAIADQWVGSDATPWKTIYSGEPNLFLPASARVFSPSVCNLPELAALFVRVEFRTDMFLGTWTGLDAIRVSGTLVPPPGRLTDPAGRVAYVPNAGVFAASNASVAATTPFDSFTYRPNDCVMESSVDSTVEVFLSSGVLGASPAGPSDPAPSVAAIRALRASEPFVTQVVPEGMVSVPTPSSDDESEEEIEAAVASEASIITLDVAAILSSFNAAAGSSPASLADFVVTLVDIAPGTTLEPSGSGADTPSLVVLQAVGSGSSMVAGAQMCSSVQAASLGGCGALTLTSPSLSIGVRAVRASTNAATTSFRLSFYATIRGQVSYLLKLNIPVNQPGTYSVWTASDNGRGTNCAHTQ
jgi:hypothetical protein